MLEDKTEAAYTLTSMIPFCSKAVGRMPAKLIRMALGSLMVCYIKGKNYCHIKVKRATAGLHEVTNSLAGLDDQKRGKKICRAILSAKKKMPAGL